MDGEHAVEVRRRQVDKQSLVYVAGVVDEMGGLAKGGARRRGDRVDVGFARHVAGRRDCVSAARLDLSRDSLRRLGTQVVDRHAIAVRAEAQGACASNPRPRACDDGAHHQTASWIATRRARRMLSDIRIA